ncbi:MAG: helix-turn-helix transcriptional regulator [Pseudomonadota bacterium]
MTSAQITLPAFGKRLQRQRRVMGVKQSALAEMVGVTQTTVSRWESAAIVPDGAVQQRVFQMLSGMRVHDGALQRLVEQSRASVHLIDDVSHVCLAYSTPRATEWRIGPRSLVGVSLWQFATDEIREAEAGLQDQGWWDALAPDPVKFNKCCDAHADIRIPAGDTLWERLYLADGTPVRLVSSA